MRRRSFIAALVCLFAAGCGSQKKHNVDPSLAKFVPEETIALAGVRLAEVQATSVYRKISQHIRLLPAEKLAAHTGFDLRRDVRELLVAYNSKDALLIGRGTFHVQVPDNVPKTNYRGHTLYGDGSTVFVLIDPTTALAGATPFVHAAIDQSIAGGSGASALIARAQALPAISQVWAVSDNRLLLVVPREGNLSNLGRFLGPLVDLTFLADLGEGLHATLTGNFKTEEDAKNLGVAARGIVGLGRLSVPQNQPDLTRLYDTVSIEQRQRTIKLESTVPADLIDRLATLLGR